MKGEDAVSGYGQAQVYTKYPLYFWCTFPAHSDTEGSPLLPPNQDYDQSVTVIGNILANLNI